MLFDTWTVGQPVWAYTDREQRRCKLPGTVVHVTADAVIVETTDGNRQTYNAHGEYFDARTRRYTAWLDVRDAP